MSDQFVAELRVVGFNFPPTGWAFANGQILPISQYTALFSLLGTNYGGNGTSNFQLPNMQGLCSVNQGTGPGLSDYVIGETTGSETVTITQGELPSHTHNVMAYDFIADQTSPANNVLALTKSGAGEPGNIYSTSGGASLNAQAVSAAGGGNPHNNMMPYLALTWLIALTGVYPSRS